MASRLCPCCSSTNLEENSTHGVLVCEECGTAVEGELTDGQDPLQKEPSYNTRPSRSGYSDEQIRVFSDKKDYSAKRLAKFIKLTNKMAEAVKLPNSKTKLCVEQAKELSKRQAVGGKGLSLNNVSAALVYIAWKGENASISAWDMVNTGVKPNILIKVTERLCSQHPDLVSVTQSEPLTDKQRLNLRLDRFPGSVEGDERKRVVAMAQDIWSMIVDVKVQDFHIRKIPINDYCILAVALQYCRRQVTLTPSEIAALAENLSMTRPTVKTRVWVIRKALLTLASRCLCLEQDVKNGVITTRNVHRYLDRLVQNKDYLISEMELIKNGTVIEEEQDSETPKKKRRKRAKKSCPSLQLPVVFANGEVDVEGLGGGGSEGGKEEGTLSDLDDEIDEYILNDKEVEMRKYLLSNGDNESS